MTNLMGKQSAHTPASNVSSGDYLQITMGQKSYIASLSQGTTTIGFNPDNTIILNDSLVSSHHARIDFNATTGYSITDLNSTNGTLLEGVKLPPNVVRPWASGQTVQIGNTRLTLVCVSPGASAGSGVIAPGPSVGPGHQPPPGDYVQITMGQNAYTVYLTKASTTIGTKPDNTIVLNDPTVSSEHACINFNAATGYSIVDLNSTNHTFIEGRKLTPKVAAPWTPGQTVQIGQTHLTLNRVLPGASPSSGVIGPAPRPGQVPQPPSGVIGPGPGTVQVPQPQSGVIGPGPGAGQAPQPYSGVIGPAPGIRQVLQPSSGDYLEITVGQNSYTVPLSPPTMTLGTKPDNTIILSDSTVSGHHARIDVAAATGYSIVDLGSTNGTLLEGMRLTPNVARPWLAGQTVQMGNTRLTLKQAQASYVSATMALNAPSVDPGNSVRLNITVRNDSSIVDYFEVSVPDIPQHWLTLPPVLRLMDRQQQSVTIIVQPPLVPQSRAGTYPFNVHVTSTSNRQQSVALRGTLTVNAYTSFSSDMHPQNLRPQQEANVTLKNQGNALEYFTLTWRDKANAVTFTPPQARVDVQPGDKKDVPFRAKPHKRPWIGGETSMPFNVEIAPSKGVAQTQSGTIINQARFPVWMLTVVFMLCIVLSILGGFLYKDQTEKRTSATAATATAAQATLDATATVGQVYQAATATAESEKLAATTTATWLDADDDNDGLKNPEEIEWGTDPKVKDSDGDTLLDGAEVHGWTRDGETFSTHPMNRDTDGDALPDNTDPDPGKLPTPTPTPTNTPTPTLTPTPTPTPALPDLVIVTPIKISMRGYSDGCITADAPLVTQFCVKNLGAGTAGAFAVQAGELTWTVDDLSPGGELCLPELEGNVSGQAIVDVDDQVAEANETNNTQPIALPTPPQECTIIHLTEYSPDARWESLQLTSEHGGIDVKRLSWNGSDTDKAGFVILQPIRLEDGNTTEALRTHPKWVDNGCIKGWHTLVVLPPNAVFESQVGFVYGATSTDGVTFWVFEHHIENGREVWNKIVKVQKGYTGRLVSISADLSHLAGQKVGIELRVDAGTTSQQDWAVWVDPTIRQTK